MDEERAELFRSAYQRTIDMAKRGLSVDRSHLETARAFVAEHQPLQRALGPGCSERCTPALPCMVSPDGICEAA